jgi:predicted glycogen debranching enzyme
MTMKVTREVCTDYQRSSRLEWLLTNGRGGFAMGTVAGANTRRYHGLLVAALRAPVERHVLLSRLEEVVEGIPLATNAYPGAIHPTGYRNLIEFRADPFPTWVFEIAGGTRIEKSLFLVQGEDTAVVVYRATRPCRLSIAPFLAFRDYHSLVHANPSLAAGVREERGAGALTLRVHPYQGLPGLRLCTSPAARFVPEGGWYFAHQYEAERDRGLDFSEDLWKMGTLTLEAGPGQPAFVVASLSDRAIDAREVARLEEEERARQAPAFADPFAARLARAAGQYVVRRQDGSPTVIAGYPWFTDWGRDTMIALPGLLLSRGRFDEARDVIRGFLAHRDQGLLPNRFPDRGEAPEYNTVDATLWLFQAAFAYFTASGDDAFVREILPALGEILRFHREGTRHGIRVDPRDRLLAAGEPGAQLTWMDAKVGDLVVTPRHGKPVEINALWYNALRIAARFARAAGDPAAAASWSTEADLVEQSFARAFWNPSRGCLYDVVGGPGGDDRAIRPNQIFAFALPFPLLDIAQRRSAMRVLEKELLTPYGLRTLARDEPGYVALFRGGPWERDSAYHQGTVWPWLIGPYVRGYLAAFGRTPANLAACRRLLDPLEAHLSSDACLGQATEVFDAEEPYRPGGCPAQAWSVAELLRLLTVDLVEPAVREKRPSRTAGMEEQP